MAKETRLAIARRDIVAFFESRSSAILTRSEIGKALEENRAFWRLAQSETVDSFVRYLLKHTELRRHEFGYRYRKEVRYTWGEVPLYELILSTKRDAYFSHYTALYFHELTEQVPKTIYLNQEQTKASNSTGVLSQAAIDRAFQRSQRQSKNCAKHADFNICVINGRNTGRLGVGEMVGPEQSKIRATDIERTLLDAAVRPAYCGGVFEVLNAYRLARGVVSINRLCAYYKTLEYIYPYHQAIGFYLERAGYKESQIGLFREFPARFDFYLANALGDTDHSERWRLFVPKGL